ncbi:uncharacterized protein LOC144311574 isoform X3 [Canis aureus]
MAPALPELHCGKPPGNHLHHPFPTPSANPRSVPGLPATGRFARLRWSPRIGSALRLRWSPPIGSALHLRWSPCIGSALRLRWSPRIGSALRLRWSPRIGSALHLRWSPRIGSALHLRWSPPIGSALHLRLLRDSRPPRRPAWNTRRGPFSGAPGGPWPSRGAAPSASLPASCGPASSSVDAAARHHPGLRLCSPPHRLPLRPPGRCVALWRVLALSGFPRRCPRGCPRGLSRLLLCFMLPPGPCRYRDRFPRLACRCLPPARGLTQGRCPGPVRAPRAWRPDASCSPVSKDIWRKTTQAERMALRQAELPPRYRCSTCRSSSGQVRSRDSPASSTRKRGQCPPTQQGLFPGPAIGLCGPALCHLQPHRRPSPPPQPSRVSTAAGHCPLPMSPEPGVGSPDSPAPTIVRTSGELPQEPGWCYRGSGEQPGPASHLPLQEPTPRPVLPQNLACCSLDTHYSGRRTNWEEGLSRLALGGASLPPSPGPVPRGGPSRCPPSPFIPCAE